MAERLGRLPGARLGAESQAEGTDVLRAMGSHSRVMAGGERLDL